jgi:hypothetical protein
VTNGNVLGFLAAPDREISLLAVSRAILKVRETGQTYKQIAYALGCSAETISGAVAEQNLLSFDAVARLCYFWPDETSAIHELWGRAKPELTADDHSAAIQYHAAALTRMAEEALPA